MSGQIKLSRFPVTDLFFLTSGTEGHWAGHVAETPAPICCLLHIGSRWRAEEITDLAQLPESQKAKEILGPTTPPLSGSWGEYSCISFYSHLRVLEHRVYPPQGWVGCKNVLMSPISSARESLCMKFWGTSTCLEPVCAGGQEAERSQQEIRVANSETATYLHRCTHQLQQ